MWQWLRRKQKTATGSTEPQLKGVPKHLRTKTYSAQTGYVYQYVYRGYQKLADENATEFVFDVSRDRDTRFLVLLRMLDADVAGAEARIGRELLNAERYALAKMKLFEAFDEQTEISKLETASVITAEFMENTLRTLGRIE